jgi:hypothetical protein
MSTKESSTDKKMPLPSDEVREKLLNPDFLNPSSLPDTKNEDNQVEHSSGEEVQDVDRSGHTSPRCDGKDEEAKRPPTDSSSKS